MGYNVLAMRFFVRLLALFLVLPVHEWAHAVTAYMLGDKTAKWDGRLSLNPIRHLDLMGSILMVFTGFGWAKPVPINPYNLKKINNPKAAFAVCAIAGPAANFIMAAVCMIIYKLLNIYHPSQFFISIMYILISINLSLMVFNLLPIPPLDGSRIWSAFLSDETYNKLMINEQKITIILFLLMICGLLNRPLTMLINVFYVIIDLLTKFIS